MSVSMHVGWPQGILLALCLLEVTAYAVMHGQERKPYNVVNALFSNLTLIALLVWGGFFAP